MTGVDGQSLIDTRHAFLRPVDAEGEIRDTVAVARALVSLGDVGAMLGTARMRAAQLSQGR